MLPFQQSDAELTLREGLEAYYAGHEGLVRGRGISERAREFFRCHDAAHVVFGCDVSLPEEAMVKIWSFFGTTGGLGLLREYRLPEAQEIYEQIHWSAVPGTALASLLAVPRVLARCLRMHKRWPWHDFDPYLDVSLDEIRREFGIQIVTTPRRVA